MRARRALVLSAVLAQVGLATTAFATFTGTAAAGNTIGTNTLSPLTNLSVNTSCNGLLSGSAKGTLSWTSTPSTFAAGYKIERWRAGVYQTTLTVTPRTATGYTDNPPLDTNTNYTWKVYAYMAAASWTSSIASVSATTPGPCLL